MTKRFLFSSMFLATSSMTGEALAQVQNVEQRTLVESPIPFSYNRGRNVSVTDRERPELQALGLNAGAFRIYPRLQLGVGYTDNVFQDDAIDADDAIFLIAPGVSARSTWSRHSLQLYGGATLRRYAKQDVRNENGWNLGSSARFDVGSQSSVNVEASTARLFESNFSGAALATFASPREYQRYFGTVRGNVVTGQFRLVGAVDYNKYDFKPVDLLVGGQLSQDQRDREVTRVTGQVEYAISPDTSFFVQLGYQDSSYSNPIPSLGVNRDSKSVRLIGGASFDLSSLLRGSVGIGYARYNYQAAIFPDIKGLSAEIQLEYFFSPITTFEFKAHRLGEDSTTVGTSGYFNTGASLRVDQEVLRSLLVNAWIEYEVDTYKGTDTKAKIFRVGTGGQYSLSRNIALRVTLDYGKRNLTGVLIGPEFDEHRANAVLVLQL